MRVRVPAGRLKTPASKSSGDASKSSGNIRDNVETGLSPCMPENTGPNPGAIMWFACEPVGRILEGAAPGCPGITESPSAVGRYAAAVLVEPEYPLLPNIGKDAKDCMKLGPARMDRRDRFNTHTVIRVGFSCRTMREARVAPGYLLGERLGEKTSQTTHSVSNNNAEGALRFASTYVPP